MSSSPSLVDKNVEEAALIPLNLGQPLFEEMIVLRGPNSFNIGNSVVGSGGIGGKNWVRVEYDSSKGDWWIQEMVVVKETLVAKNSNGDQIWIPLKNRQQICLFGSYNFVFVQNLQETLCGMSSQSSMGQLSQQKQEGQQVYSKTISQLEEELTCSICMEMFTNPVLYRCGHVFCGGCIAEWNLRCTEQIVLCPLCHQELNLPIAELKFYTIMLQNIIPVVKRLVDHDKEMMKLSLIPEVKPIPVAAQEVPNFTSTCPASIAIPSTSNVPVSSTRPAGKVRIIFNQSDRQSTQQSNDQIEVIDIDDDDNISSNNNSTSSGPDDDEIIWLDDPTVVAQHWQQLRQRRCPHHRRTTTATGMH